MRLPYALGRLCRTGTLILTIAFFGWLQASQPSFAATAVGPPPPGYGRIWIYRSYEPYISLATPYVLFNGRIVGVSEPGAAFYRDVLPGDYHITVQSEGRDVNQFVTVGVAPGQQVYVKVEVSKFWDCGGGPGAGWCHPTFYTRLQLPQVGATAVASLPVAKALS
jgi:hypothetical protein